MRTPPSKQLEHYRAIATEIESSGFSAVGTMNGMFSVRTRHGVLFIIASDGTYGTHTGWEHVSVSVRLGAAKGRLPTWMEMCQVKEMFWEPEEAVMQLHPPQSEYIDNHPFCLHLWRPIGVEIPRPPAELVGLQGLSYDEARQLKDTFSLDPQRTVAIRKPLRRRGA